MTIHHDKLAYGKLAPGSEELSEDKIFEMLAQLGEKEEKGGQLKNDCPDDIPEKNQKKL